MAPEKIACSYADFPESWYDLGDANHFWMKWRFQTWLKRMKGMGVRLNTPKRALDVGCGIGVFRGQVEMVTAWAVDGIDLNVWALEKSQPGRGVMMNIDITSFPTELHQKYDHVFLFDVLEHIENPALFLHASLHCLKPLGMIHINVPALSSQFSQYDLAAGHLRRYDKRSLREAVDGFGLKNIFVDYWGFSLLPYLFIRKWWVGRTSSQHSAIQKGFRPPHRLANWMFLAQMKMETFLYPRACLGTSLMLSAQKGEK